MKRIQLKTSNEAEMEHQVNNEGVVIIDEDEEGKRTVVRNSMPE